MVGHSSGCPSLRTRALFLHQKCLCSASGHNEPQSCDFLLVDRCHSIFLDPTQKHVHIKFIVIGPSDSQQANYVKESSQCVIAYQFLPSEHIYCLWQ